MFQICMVSFIYIIYVSKSKITYSTIVKTFNILLMHKKLPILRRQKQKLRFCFLIIIKHDVIKG